MERRNELTDHDIANQLFIAAIYGNGQLRMEQLMENIDIGELIVNLIKSTNIQDIAMLIKALNFIYNETTLDSPVSDELYDELVEHYKDIGGVDSVIGTDRMTVDSEELHVAHHKYPELRGSLSKIHFIQMRSRIVIVGSHWRCTMKPFSEHLLIKEKRCLHL